MMTHTDSYTFKYNSDEDSIDLNTLLLSQIHFGAILNEIKNDVAGNADLSIKIRPLAKGSVPFDIMLNVSWIENLLSPNSVGYASGIINILVGVIQLRKWLKGKKPTQIEINDFFVVITTGDTSITVNRNAYDLAQKNPVIDKALQKAFEAIESDETVSGVEILDEQKQSLISVRREDFSSMTSPSEIFEAQFQIDPATRERLSIFKVVFDKGYKWQFYLNGRKISASIQDNVFLEKIDKGESFAKGDVLVVDLEREKIFDSTMDIFVEKEFRIQKVHEHIPRPIDNQSSLFEGK